MKKSIYIKIVLVVIILAILIRLIYIIKIPITAKQHDVLDKNGHLYYILEIYNNNHLPQNNDGQFYHPPLHHIISAIWLKGVSVFITDERVLLESIQVLTLIYSIITIILCYKILEEFYISYKYKILGVIIMAFYPSFIILSGSINNDALLTMLMVFVIWRLIKWNKKINTKNTIFLAIVTGLCVMTKTSGGIMSVPIMYVFIVNFVRYINKGKSLKKLFKQFFIFGIISLPIGLWYPIRNYLKFGQPIFCILDPNLPELYVGNYTIFERFFPKISDLDVMYCHPFDDYNIPIYLIKCAVFGEYTWNIKYTIIYDMAIVCNIILFAVFILSTIRLFYKKSKRYIVEKNMLLIFLVTNIISFISMNLSLPYGCSMDFRYIVLVVFVGMMFMVLDIDLTVKRKCKIKK